MRVEVEVPMKCFPEGCSKCWFTSATDCRVDGHLIKDEDMLKRPENCPMILMDTGRNLYIYSGYWKYNGIIHGVVRADSEEEALSLVRERFSSLGDNLLDVYVRKVDPDMRIVEA